MRWRRTFSQAGVSASFLTFSARSYGSLKERKQREGFSRSCKESRSNLLKVYAQQRMLERNRRSPSSADCEASSTTASTGAAARKQSGSGPPLSLLSSANQHKKAEKIAHAKVNELPGGTTCGSRAE